MALLITRTQFAKVLKFCTWNRVQNNTAQSNTESQTDFRCAKVGIDICGHRSKSLKEFDGQKIDYVITVCDSARESCPVFFGAAERRHHNWKNGSIYFGGCGTNCAAIYASLLLP